jgi:hypothetical protein
MEELIRQAFLHVEGLGPHVAEGHYDLIGPNGEIILPRVWETTIEPDWAISMHMWPIPEPSKPPLPGRGVPSLAPGHHFRANHGRPPSRHVPPSSQMRAALLALLLLRPQPGCQDPVGQEAVPRLPALTSNRQ